MADGSPITFDIQTPKLDVQANVDYALGLGLPEIDVAQKHLTLIANGPSARHLDLSKVTGDTMAINGALELFSGAAPTYWIACDPQALVANFVTDAPASTIYLIASKCHPLVFERLRHHDVRVWHVSDVPIPDKRQVPCAVSVTLCALLLAQRLGYRTIDVYGWDCCFDGEAHHAGPGGLSSSPQRIEMTVESDPPEVYESNPTWAAEVNDAAGILPVLRWVGCDVRIHGRSLVAGVCRDFAAT